MASLPFIKPKQVITNGDMSQANVYSSVTSLQQMGACSYTASWTGAPVGTFNVLVCNDYVYNDQSGTPDPHPENHGTWSAVTLSASVIATGAPGGANINVPFRGHAWVMLQYVKTSGTGTLQATVAGKQTS